LHQELADRGVRVTALCPGPVPTEFQARAGLGDRMPNVLSLPAERVARIGYDGFMRGKRVVVAGTGNRIAAFVLRFLPNTLLLPLLDWGTRRAARSGS
jgi:short-subunit dehydrogenase